MQKEYLREICEILGFVEVLRTAAGLDYRVCSKCGLTDIDPL